MNYIELTVNVEPKEQGSDILIATLSDLGFESFVDSEKGFIAYVLEEEFSEEEVQLSFNDIIDLFFVKFVFLDISNKTIFRINKTFKT